jgi:transcriptional regulator
MYIRDQHNNSEFLEAIAFIETLSFGVLVSDVEGRTWGVHLPFIVNKDDSLSTHMAKPNPLAQQWLSGEIPNEVMCIFKGAGAYISGSWYLHEEVSTYDYSALHLYAKIELLDAEETLKDLEVLMDRHESGQKNPKPMSAYKQSTLSQYRGVLGFKLYPTHFYFAQKLSQERTEDLHSVIGHLENGTAEEQRVAQDIKKQSFSK